jgi:hypothetical protein
MTGVLSLALLAATVGIAGAQAIEDGNWGYAASSDQCDQFDQCLDPCACGKPACKKCCGFGHCTSVWGDFLFLHPTGADVPHAQQQNGTGGAGTVPFGIVGEADPDYEPGVRVGGVIGLSPCSSIALAYTFFESDTVSFVEPPIVPGGGGAVGSLVQHPGAALIASAGPVEATYEIDFQLGEIEYRSLLWGDHLGWVNYSAGLRYAHLEQDFAQFGFFGGSQAGVINTQTRSDFDGGGALFGLDGERIIGCKGFSLYGNAGVSPVVGQFTTTYSMYNESTDVLLADVRWKDDRFVTILDYELGLAWTSCSGCLRLSAGYMAQFWYNTITTPELIDAVRATNYTDVGDTLSFDGLVTRVEVRF